MSTGAERDWLHTGLLQPSSILCVADRAHFSSVFQGNFSHQPPMHTGFRVQDQRRGLQLQGRSCEHRCWEAAPSAQPHSTEHMGWGSTSRGGTDGCGARVMQKNYVTFGNTFSHLLATEILLTDSSLFYLYSLCHPC